MRSAALLSMALLVAGCSYCNVRGPRSGAVVGYGPEDIAWLRDGRLLASCGCLGRHDRPATRTRGLYCVAFSDSAARTDWVALRGQRVHGIDVSPDGSYALVSAHASRGSRIWRVETGSGISSLWTTTEEHVNDLVISPGGRVYAATSLALGDTLRSRAVAQVLELQEGGSHRVICTNVFFGAGIACWRGNLLVSSSLGGEVWIVDPTTGRHRAIARGLGCADNITPDPLKPDTFYVAALQNRYGFLVPALNRSEVWKLELSAADGFHTHAGVARVLDLPCPALISCALPDGKGGFYFGRNLGRRVDHLKQARFRPEAPAAGANAE